MNDDLLRMTIDEVKNNNTINVSTVLIDEADELLSMIKAAEVDCNQIYENIKDQDNLEFVNKSMRKLDDQKMFLSSIIGKNRL